jgi:Zn-finger nucleic acid-binding protein
MDCPACREPVVVLELHDVEIDHCLTCRGIWLDAGELELLLGDCAWKDRLLSSFEVDREAEEKPRKCPICLRRMQKVLCGTDCRVRIDRCRRNHGIWFDAGELEEILRMGSLGGSTEVLDLLADMFGKRP